MSGLRYADPLGEPRLRDVIAARGGAGGAAAASPDRIVVTLGAIEALNHAFLTTAAATGSRRIGIESPGYFMLASMVSELGLEVVPIRREGPDERLDLDMLRRELRRASIAAMMVNPNHQNPTGATLSLAQRFELAALAQERGFFIIEDDVYKGLWVHDEEPPSDPLTPPRANAVPELVFEDARRCAARGVRHRPGGAPRRAPSA